MMGPRDCSSGPVMLPCRAASSQAEGYSSLRLIGSDPVIIGMLAHRAALTSHQTDWRPAMFPP